MFFLLVLHCALHGQTRLTLDQCIDYALKNNLSIRQSEMNAQISKNNSRQVKAGSLPALNGGAAHTYNFGKTIDRFTNTFADQMVLSQNLFLSTNLTIWSGLTQLNNIRQSEYNYLAAVENVNQQKNDLSLNVATAFLQVVYAEQLKNIQKNQKEISEQQLEQTKKLAEAGTIAIGNIYDVEAQLASDQFNYTSAENNYSVALLTLQQLLNLDSLKNFSIEIPTVSEEQYNIKNLNVQEIYNIALKNQPVMKSASLNLKGAERGLAAAKGFYSPNLSISAALGTGYSGLNYNYDYNYGYSPAGFTNNNDTVYLFQVNPIRREIKSFADQFNGNINKSISFQLNVPIFNGLRTHTGVTNGKLNVFAQKLNYDLARQQLWKSIVQAHINAVAATEKLNASKRAVEAAENSFRFSETKFNAGTISVFDFSTAKSRLLKAQSDYLNAKFDLIFRMKVLDFYQGKPLTFN